MNKNIILILLIIIIVLIGYLFLTNRDSSTSTIIETETETETETITEAEFDEYNAIVGLHIDEAKAYAEANEIDLRTGIIDGEAMPVTSDFRPGRITVEVLDGVVIGYTVE